MIESTQDTTKRSPMRLMLILLFSIITIEFGIMGLIVGGLHEVMTEWTLAALDSIILTVLLLPILYFFMLRPLTRQIEEHKKSEARFRALIESAPQCIILSDSDGRVVFANAQTEATFGYPGEELAGRNIELLVPERDSPAHAQRRVDYFAAPTARPMGAGRDLFGLRKNGTEVPVEVALKPLRLGERSYVLAFVVDISKRKQAEKSIEHASRVKSEFMANVTHELRTPLNSVIGFAELLQDEVPGPLNVKQADFVSDILASGQSLLALVESILEMSRLDAAEVSLQREPVEIGAALQECLARHREAAAARGLTLQLEGAADSGSVQLAPGALRRMLDVLLDNAIKFSPDGSTVAVSARRDGGAIEIAVTDTGIGIAHADLPKLFRPLTQLDAGLARRQGGIGMGLALAQRIAELHGGTIDVTSEPDKGSTFTLRLPIKEQP